MRRVPMLLMGVLLVGWLWLQRLRLNQPRRPNWCRCSFRLNPNRPKVPDLAPLIAAVYSRPDGGAGCCLHVVTDDGNWDCAPWLTENVNPQHRDCVAAVAMMQLMTESQIARATKRADAMVWAVAHAGRTR